LIIPVKSDHLIWPDISARNFANQAVLIEHKAGIATSHVCLDTELQLQLNLRIGKVKATVSAEAK